MCRTLDLDLDAKIGYIADEDVLRIEEILENPQKFDIPSWMLNRREDYETGDDIHLIESDLDMTLRDDLNRMKKTRSYKGRRHEVKRSKNQIYFQKKFFSWCKTFKRIGKNFFYRLKYFKFNFIRRCFNGTT